MFGYRPDATLAQGVPNVRRIMPFILPTRNESLVYFEQVLDLTETQRFIDEINATRSESRVTLFHVISWATVRMFEERPRLNRFVAGRRLWQRRGIWLSYSAKKSFDDNSPVVVLKREFQPGETLDQTITAMTSVTREGRSDKKSHVDKELGLLFLLPNLLISFLVAASRMLDHLGLMPRSLIDKDPMYCSAFIANLGSLGMDSAYHHLFEYGTCPILCVIGKAQPRVLVQDGQAVVRPTVSLKYTFDERIEDGFYAERALSRLRELVEDPRAHGA